MGDAYHAALTTARRLPCGVLWAQTLDRPAVRWRDPALRPPRSNTCASSIVRHPADWAEDHGVVIGAECAARSPATWRSVHRRDQHGPEIGGRPATGVRRLGRRNRASAFSSRSCLFVATATGAAALKGCASGRQEPFARTPELTSCGSNGAPVQQPTRAQWQGAQRQRL